MLGTESIIDVGKRISAVLRRAEEDASSASEFDKNLEDFLIAETESPRVLH